MLGPMEGSRHCGAQKKQSMGDLKEWTAINKILQKTFVSNGRQPSSQLCKS